MVFVAPEADEHGDFRYTLRQFLLMRQQRLWSTADWSDVVKAVTREFSENPDWDPEEKNTYRGWRQWYYGDRNLVASDT